MIKSDINIKKTAIIILAFLAVIFTSVFGSYAYFTSNASIKSNLIITTGNLKLEEVEGASWEYSGVVETDTYNSYDKALVDQSNSLEKDNFTLVKPGDKFVKIVTIKNTGSLTQKLEIKDLSSEISNDLVKFSIEDGLSNNVVLNPSETRSFTIVATITSSISNGENNINQDKAMNFEEIILEISGKQMNDLNS